MRHLRLELRLTCGAVVLYALQLSLERQHLRAGTEPRAGHMTDRKEIHPEAWIQETLPRRKAWGGATLKQGLKRTAQASNKKESGVA